jgi:hypothetical protein
MIFRNKNGMSAFGIMLSLTVTLALAIILFRAVSDQGKKITFASDEVTGLINKYNPNCDIDHDEIKAMDGDKCLCDDDRKIDSHLYYLVDSLGTQCPVTKRLSEAGRLYEESLLPNQVDSAKPVAAKPNDEDMYVYRIDMLYERVKCLKIIAELAQNQDLGTICTMGATFSKDYPSKNNVWYYQLSDFYNPDAKGSAASQQILNDKGKSSTVFVFPTKCASKLLILDSKGVPGYTCKTSTEDCDKLLKDASC